MIMGISGLTDEYSDTSSTWENRENDFYVKPPVSHHPKCQAQQAAVVQRLDNPIHWINRYTVDKC